MTANGYLVIKNRIPAKAIAAIRAEIARFEDEARGMTASNDRLDLEDSHSPDAPAHPPDQAAAHDQPR